MGQKDLSEKILMDYNDIFSDIINVLLFNGEQTVSQDSLSNALVHSQYKSDDSVLHEEERDIFKYWAERNIQFAMLGIENQTKAFRLMPLRVIGYDGASYRMQLLKGVPPVPVVTIILYFGTDQRWSGPRSLKELFPAQKKLDPYINDYRIHVFEIAWLDDETVSKFKSDFRVIANFFVKKRKHKNYEPTDKTEIKHVDEVLKLLSIMTGDEQYASILTTGKEGIHNMCDVADRLVNKGIKQGIDQGIKQGIDQGVALITQTIKRLQAGETSESIIKSGISEKIVHEAQSCIK